MILKNISESGLVHATYSKLKLIKVKDDVQERNNEYEELINNLISENQQILSIANMYKDEYERINISDEDIDHLQSTIRRVINLLNENSESDDTDTNDLESCVDLIQKDTLKTM